MSKYTPLLVRQGARTRKNDSCPAPTLFPHIFEELPKLHVNGDFAFWVTLHSDVGEVGRELFELGVGGGGARTGLVLSIIYGCLPARLSQES